MAIGKTSLRPPNAQVTPRLLLVEDDEQLGPLFNAVLRGAGFEVTLAEDGRAGIERFREHDFDVVITDLTMPRMDGMELFRSIRELDQDVPVVIITAAPQLDSAMRAMEYGALRYIAKPIKNAELVSVARSAYTLHELARMKRIALDRLNDEARQQEDQTSLHAMFEAAYAGVFMSYQPIVSWSQRRIVGYEALLRSHDKRMATPGELFEAAKQLNRFRDLGRRIRELAPRAFEHNQYPLFINVDASDLTDDQLFDERSALVAMASRVVVELTERVALDTVDGATDRVERVRNLGFKIAIDDLGAGYAGLSYFGAIEPDLCKLDMTLVRGIERSSTKQKVVGGMVRMCKDLGITLVCEGVETVAERDALLALDCDVLQGFLFAQPKPELGDVAF